MRALITGITGFAGSHLCEFLLEQSGVEVFGTYRWRSRMENVEHLRQRITLVESDMRDASAVRQALNAIRPNVIYHLAAQSFVPTSWTAPMDTFASNAVGELNLLEGVRLLELDPIIHLACSSEEYGLVYPDELPIREDSPLRPLSPYAVSKVAQDLLGFQYFHSYGLRVIRTRAFNHTGPRQADVFAASNFAHQLAEIERGLREPVLLVGNLDTERDFTDVRDMVRAYWLATEHGEPGEVYNIASGLTHRIRDVVELLLAHSTVAVEVRPDPARQRPSDVPLLQGDCGKFRRLTGWQPTITLEETLADLLAYWRQRVGC